MTYLYKLIFPTGQKFDIINGPGYSAWDQIDKILLKECPFLFSKPEEIDHKVLSDLGFKLTYDGVLD